MRILVVDENQDAARSLAAILQLKGHAIRVAFNGSLAVKEADMFKPHLVLMDISMSGMDGLQSCRIMRQALPHTMCIVAITGHDAPEDRQRTANAGFNDHLRKPVDFARLDAILHTLDARVSDETCNNAAEQG
jgi:DNA-binding response OmpR family regulator